MATRASLLLRIGGLVAIVAVVIVLSVISPKFFNVEYDNAAARDNKKQLDVPTTTPVKVADKSSIVPTHIKTPESVRAIYMSQCVVGTRNFRDRLVKLVDETELNSIIIDIKDFTGYISFTTDNPKLSSAVSDDCGAVDMLEFIDSLHKKDIYVIGRITVFQDPRMSKLRPDLAVRKLSDGGVWADHKGLNFIDVGAREHWDFIATLAEESYKIGFDEINFDYIRFPSDGNMKDTDYTLSRGKTRPEALEEFFVYLSDRLKPQGIPISADLFGMVTTNYDDLGIGQVLERALPHFDFVAPMVYPSHYPKNFNGWPDPNKVPYELIKFVMTSAVDRANAMDANQPTTTPVRTTDTYKKLRPWLQDFDYGGTYDTTEVKAQIQATYDSGLNSWMLWAPSNIYTAGALQSEAK
ncbi:MAG TPA: putative glycoside hydrolase [Candidatus Nanoarchaeia archaeon]|nr:putative glycoside hydrolase [Candidatus Nanoarchaeia archaeon]